MISVFLLTGRLVSFRKKVMTIKTPVSWMGNKTSILHILYALFPKSYTRYIEPFGGSGAVLLGKSVPDKFEVYNDYNANLVNLFRCMRDRPMEFIRELGFLNLNSRDDFTVIKRFFQKEEFDEKYLEQQLELTNIMLPELQAKELCELYRQTKGDYDLKRAVMFLKLVRYSYSSGGKSFACQPFNVAALFILIEQLGKRLANAVIENQDFEVLIKHYDRPDSFFYCDPPYYTSEYVYECGFTWEDHMRLFRVLSECKGQWLVSYNDCPEIRELYRDYNQFSFTRIHSMVQKYEAGKEFPELLIGNYDLYEREKRETGTNDALRYRRRAKTRRNRKNLKGVYHIMQDKKVNKFVLLPVPLEDCAAAGICEGCILQSYTENGRLIISRVSKEDFICDNDCESCPIADVDCDGDCRNCPCVNNCEDAEVDIDE